MIFEFSNGYQSYDAWGLIWIDADQQLEFAVDPQSHGDLKISHNGDVTGRKIGIWPIDHDDDGYNMDIMLA